MGILFMVAGLCLLILVHEFGHWLVAQYFGFQTPVFSIGFGSPYIVLGRWRKTEFRLSPWLLGGYVSLPEMADESTAREVMQAPCTELKQYKEFPIWQRSLVALAGVTMNVITAVVLTFILFTAIGKPSAQVADVYVSGLSATNTIARDAGLQTNDVFVSVDGQTVKSPDDVVKLISAHKGTPARLIVERGNQQVAVTVTPDAGGKIGIAVGAHAKIVYQKEGPIAGAVDAVKTGASLVGRIYQGIGMMLHIVPTPKDLPAGASDVHGIVAIVQMGSSAFASGLADFLWFLAAISLNLAVFNILPIPVLDGGYLLFFTIEKVRGKRLERGLQQRIQLLFMALLLLLFVYGLYNDVAKPVQMPK